MPMSESISYTLEPDGLRIFIRGYQYTVRYPRDVYANLNTEVKRLLAENFIYCRAASLLLASDEPSVYDFKKPINRDFVFYGIHGDIPRLAYINNLSSDSLRGFLQKNQSQELFTSVEPAALLPLETSATALLAMSFGKDSLLTYGVARELGLPMRLVYVREMESLNEPEEKWKSAIMDNFIKQEKTSIDILTDNIDQLFVDIHGDRPIHDLENANGMLAFTLQLMPFAYHYGTRYMLFGNEANFSDYFPLNGERIYPSFDQSIEYAEKKNKLLDVLTGDSIQVASLIESIYNIGEMAVLVGRYPDLIPFLMSCSPQEGDADRWCYRCPMCAKAFLYLNAVGGNPVSMGFHRDFFEAQYADLYPLFSQDITRVYEKPVAVRDEQLLSFLLAYRRGKTGPLMTRFEELFLAEAIEREEELRKKFLGIHSSPTVPSNLRDRIAAIYQEELSKI